MKTIAFLLVIGLVCGMTGISEAKRPNPAIDNTVILCAGYGVEINSNPSSPVCVGTTVQFSIVLPCGWTFVSACWTFSGGTPGTGSGTTPSTTYNSPGEDYNVTMTGMAKDQCGQSRSISGAMTITVCKLEIIEPNEDPITDNNFFFTSGPTGKCNIVVQAQILPKELSTTENLEAIEWTLTDIEGSSWRKQGYMISEGVITVAFVYTGLPEENDEFGEGKVTATFTLNGATCSAEQILEIFFSKKAKNHPDGDDPNWFYYWNQKASVGDPIYDEKYPKYGYFDPTTPDEIYVGKKGGGTWHNLYIGTLKGIDSFAATCRHELRHKEDYNHTQEVIASGEDDDRDGDWMPTKEEPLLKNHDGEWYGKLYGKDFPFDSNKYWTYFPQRSPYSDKEIRALDEDYYWKKHREGDYDSIDWSKPGHQWKK